MGQRTRVAALTGVLILASGCTPNQTSTESSTSGTSDESAIASSTTEGSSAPTSSVAAATSSVNKRPPIRDVDFGNATWRHLDLSVDGKPVRLRNGRAQQKAPDEITPADFTLKRDRLDAPKFVDVDGDGHEDAVVTVQSTRGNGWSQETFVWRWDPATNTAVQLRNPVARDGRCGDVTDALAFDGKGNVTVSYRDCSTACAEDPPNRQQKTLHIDRSGAAYQTKPWPSALTTCQPDSSGDVWFEKDLGPHIKGFRSAPSDSAPVIIPRKDVDMWNAVNVDRHKPGKWLLVWYIPKAKKLAADEDTFPCGWVKADG